MQTKVHGALVEILGVGVLIRGPSGIGKSETALELVTRGHRLVADDVVELCAAPGGGLRGRAPELIRHHLEIRGIGILYVPDLYGADAVRDESDVDLVCRLERWREDASYDRLGLDRPQEALLEHELPCIVLPVRPAGNMATLLEVAVRDQLQRRAGVVAAHRLDARVRGRAGPP